MKVYCGLDVNEQGHKLPSITLKNWKRQENAKKKDLVNRNKYFLSFCLGVVVFLAIVIRLTVYLVKQQREASILNKLTYANSFKNPGIRDYSVQ
jgi:hypothetical protein